MKRRATIVGVATLLSAASFALVLGLWWLVSYLILNYIPQLMHTRAQAHFAVLSIAIVIVAALGAGLTTLTNRVAERPRKAHHWHMRPRFHH
ncbi:hypothetical protein [Occallatibacter riparius]|uniref:Uncharacterized protein n=1 Tax=Occallatibacter riparius TaxID=1002689 RepID=A0A9J7BND0_9BACT|nr:hypothetical protein [Occallatibacter riparius]UWZ82677.1 hypothetical protein MOP44_19155 [Occallatibacter riparius]